VAGRQRGEVFRGIMRINAFKRSEVRLTRVPPPRTAVFTWSCDAALLAARLRRCGERVWGVCGGQAYITLPGVSRDILIACNYDQNRAVSALQENGRARCMPGGPDQQPSPCTFASR
jgi:hypothetical protein